MGKLLTDQELKDFFDEITKPCVPDEGMRKMLKASFVQTVQSQKRLYHVDQIEHHIPVRKGKTVYTYSHKDMDSHLAEQRERNK